MKPIELYEIVKEKMEKTTQNIFDALKTEKMSPEDVLVECCNYATSCQLDTLLPWLDPRFREWAAYRITEEAVFRYLAWKSKTGKMSGDEYTTIIAAYRQANKDEIPPSALREPENFLIYLPEALKLETDKMLKDLLGVDDSSAHQRC